MRVRACACRRVCIHVLARAAWELVALRVRVRSCWRMRVLCGHGAFTSAASDLLGGDAGLGCKLDGAPVVVAAAHAPQFKHADEQPGRV
eukprot:118402-Pleurochrysis_carterae.AAC.1